VKADREHNHALETHTHWETKQKQNSGPNPAHRFGHETRAHTGPFSDQHSPKRAHPDLGVSPVYGSAPSRA